MLQLETREGHQILLGLEEGVAQDRMISVETDAVLENDTALTMSIDRDILHHQTERTPEVKGRQDAGNPMFLNRDRVETTSGKMETLGQ